VVRDVLLAQAVRDAIDRPMAFSASLENAVPLGTIGTSGTFGPWGRDEPGQPPLEEQFTFERADLGVFKGISGILSPPEHLEAGSNASRFTG
jgi:hypothetical protein